MRLSIFHFHSPVPPALWSNITHQGPAIFDIFDRYDQPVKTNLPPKIMINISSVLDSSSFPCKLDCWPTYVTLCERPSLGIIFWRPRLCWRIFFKMCFFRGLLFANFFVDLFGRPIFCKPFCSSSATLIGGAFIHLYPNY